MLCTTTANSTFIRPTNRHRMAGLQGSPPCFTDRLVTAADLMPNGTGLMIPRLDRVPVEHRFRASDRAAIRLSQALVELHIADPSDWERIHRVPTDYLRATLNRWIDLHGAKTIRRRFCLSLMLSSVLDEYFDAGE